MHGFRLILILAVIGGIVAYLGDKVGMRIGRRRLTLFGLRPKHTSVLITIVTGILIVAISLTMLSIASEDVRTALFRMQELQQALVTTRVQYDGLKGELSQRQAELETTQAQRDAATAELDAAEERLSLIGAEYDRAVADLREAEDSLEFTRNRVANLQQIGTELQARVDEMQQLVTDMEVEILVKEAQIRAAEAQIQAANVQIDQIRGGELAFRAGDIVLSSIFDAGRPADEVRTRLLELLERADLMAVQRGARLPEQDLPTALQLVDGVFAGTVQMLTDTSERWIVRIVSLYNTTVGEPVAVDLELVEEQRIYRRGDVVVETVVEGGGSGPVRDELIRLLQTVNDEAIGRGMLTDDDGFVSEGISFREFVDALSIIEQMGGRARVQAIVVEDTVNTDWPLRIRLKIDET